jgi:uncharacterized membrane protein (UPF0127 family)
MSAMRAFCAVRHIFADVLPDKSENRSFFNQSRGVLLADAARVAGTSKQRRRGLMGCASIAPGEGVWIVPCEAIHTFGMKTPIDSIFLDKQLRVRAVRPHLKPGRIALCLRAHSVLELAPGTIERSGTQVGDRICLG